MVAGSDRGRSVAAMIVQLSHALIGAGSRWVLWVLVGMSALSLSVIVDRGLALLGQHRDLNGLIGESNGC